jgi:hypothetical protein
MEDSASSIATSGSGQIYQNSQWVADVKYEQVNTIATQAAHFPIAKLTLTSGQLANLAGKAGIELITQAGSCHSILLPFVTPTVAHAILLT